ncbi:hypothetical protein GCM10022215_06170 [Nocardioides fonticola]|uniref:Uncharacterized protein n=1 Tax=Nocardioides fonticola TaxID=450363 RepID=A0ABP7XBR9_9ACTN
MASTLGRAADGCRPVRRGNLGLDPDSTLSILVVLIDRSARPGRLAPYARGFSNHPA